MYDIVDFCRELRGVLTRRGLKYDFIRDCVYGHATLIKVAYDGGATPEEVAHVLAGIEHRRVAGTRVGRLL